MREIEGVVGANGWFNELRESGLKAWALIFPI